MCSYALFFRLVVQLGSHGHVVCAPSLPEETTSLADYPGSGRENLEEFASRILHANITSGVRPTLPSSLETLPWFVYSLWRGPLFSYMLQHTDDIYSLRELFACASLDIMRRMACPNLFVVHSAGEMESVPPTTLELRHNRVLLLDNFTHVFVWKGSDVVAGDPREMQCQVVANRMLSEQFPAPHVLVVEEGASLARGVLCRLAPFHNDTIAEQIADCPSIQDVPGAARQGLAPLTQDLSLRQFRTQVLKL
eukprot:m.162183 g.162183  ORF g.162183 m.162183 type:complete len:251 (+) comp17084_c1_seq1:2615-3367(+)